MEKPMTCIFIAGATGYTGSAFVKRLAQAKHDVVAHIRPDSPSMAEMAPLFKSHGARIDTSPWEPAAIADALKASKATHVASLLGTTRARARKASKKGIDATYEAVERDMTLMLLAAAQDMKEKPRFIFLSAMGADKSGGNRYMAARTMVEKAIFNSGLNYLIARPAFISGSDRSEFRLMERSATIISDGILSMTGLMGARKFRDSYRSLNAEQLAAGMATLALREGNIIANPFMLRHPDHSSHR